MLQKWIKEISELYELYQIIVYLRLDERLLRQARLPESIGAKTKETDFDY